MSPENLVRRVAPKTYHRKRGRTQVESDGYLDTRDSLDNGRFTVGDVANGTCMGTVVGEVL